MSIPPTLPPPSSRSAPRRTRRGPLPLLRPLPLLLTALFSLFTFHFSLAAPPAPPSDPSRLFVEASRAYDENRLDDAIATLQTLLDSGQTLPPVLYNLGNALYRNGRLGEAIRAYRQAQWLAPRDPDIRANLGFAAQTAGITLPAPSAPVAFLLTLTTREWLHLLLLALWLLCALGAVALLLPRTRHALRLPAALLALLLLLSLAGITTRHLQQRHPEYVLQTPTSLLSAPLETSTPLLSLPEGTILRALAPRPPYLQVLVPTTTPPTTGWLPSTTLLPVLPPPPAPPS